MPDLLLPELAAYQPDAGPKKRLENAALSKPPVTVDKPIQFRVARVQPKISHRRPARKTRKRTTEPDLRNPHYY